MCASWSVYHQQKEKQSNSVKQIWNPRDAFCPLLFVGPYFPVLGVCQDTLASGKVIPGFGHGVLRNTDPCLVSRFGVQVM